MDIELSTPWTLAVAAAVLCLFYLLTKKFLLKSGNRPPGPRGWKGFMEILQAGRDDTLYEAAWGWAEKYGDITFYTVLGQPMCILNSSDISRRLFGSDEYKLLTADRDPTVVSELAWYNGKELFFTPYNSQTRQKRTLFHKVMGIHGEGVDKFEGVVGKELDRVLKKMDTIRATGQDIPITQILSRSLKIILYVLIKGDIDPEKLSQDVTDTMERYDNAINQMFDIQTVTALTFFPFLRKVGKYKKICDDVVESKVEAEKIMFEELKSTYQEGKVRGMADALLHFQSQPGHEWLDDENIKGFLTTTFFGAHMTSRASLLNMVLTLIHHPEVARRIQEEIESVLGDRRPRVEDRMSMHYTEAVILENIRFVSQVPLSGLRSGREDIHIDGYVIPKGTRIMANQWFFHHNPELWDDPWKFKPERFLDESGVILPANHPVRKKFLAFGHGVRMCPGEAFARSRIFLFTVMILQKFDLLAPENEPLPSCDPRENLNGVVRQAPPFKCRLRNR
ncbi:steroid 17-alpha-hydroxylase/17,20 lyase-like [Aplysia californica]|uniref:Steroid 17-alpha-hydroxylase/17,20 lyase-like n=1 Tax=Aplysia californica TaxID=6500 RepID=A0ABM0JFE3_APLCA|nr:steroid 17-alpha-hydroxylase/17,20 lyase-like [Aplysia californica]